MKTKKAFLILSIFCSLTLHAEDNEPLIGRTPEERERFVRESEQAIDCLEIDLNKKMTIPDFMAACVDGVVSDDNCDLNLEKACVNGVEVDLWGRAAGYGKDFGFGFNARVSNAVSTKNFSDPSKMYNKILLPNGQSTQLCTKVSGLPENPAPGVLDRILVGEKFPPSNYVIESVPPSLNPSNSFAGTTLHYKIIVSMDPNGKQQIRAEVQLRDSDAIDKEISGPDYKAGGFRVTGDRLSSTRARLFTENLVKCKKAQTSVDGENMKIIADGAPSTMPTKYKSDYQKAQQFWLNANPGLNKEALTTNFENVFKLNEKPVR